MTTAPNSLTALATNTTLDPSDPDYEWVDRGLVISSPATGLDPKSLGVPEVFCLRRQNDYAAALHGFSTGDPEGITRWLLFHCEALEAGSREARARSLTRRRALDRARRRAGR